MNVGKSDENIRMTKLLCRIIDLPEKSFDVLSKELGQDSEEVSILIKARFEMYN